MQSLSLSAGSGFGIVHGKIKYKIANRVVMSWQKANHLPLTSMKSATAHSVRGIPLQVRAMGNSSEPPYALLEEIFIKAINEAPALSNEDLKLSIHDLTGPRDPNGTLRVKKLKLPGDTDSDNDEDWTEIETPALTWDDKCNICGKRGDHISLLCPYRQYYPEGAHLEPDTPLVLVDNSGQTYNRNDRMYDGRCGPRRVMKVLKEPKFADGKYSEETGY